LKEFRIEVNNDAAERDRATERTAATNLRTERHVELVSPAGTLEKLKTAIFYGADATRVYREALDACHDGHEVDIMQREWQNELVHLTRRGHTTGFYLGGGTREIQENGRHSLCKSQRLLDLILSDDCDGRVMIRAFNKIRVGQTLEVMSFFRKDDRLCTVIEIVDMKGDKIEKTGAGEVVYIRTDTKCQPNEILRTV
jgi:hypothetical protein